GTYLMEGMQKGIQTAGQAVVSAAERVSTQIASGIQANVKSVSDGARNVVSVYRGMYGQLDAMTTASKVALNGSMSAVDAAGKETQANGGAIAQAPITVIQNNEGIVARS